MRRSLLLAAATLQMTLTQAVLNPLALAQTQSARPHNVVLFIADGLRFRMVDDNTAPTMAAMARQGVSLRNGHALFPTFTMANASGMATGHMLGDTGTFSNTIYTGFEVPGAGSSLTPFLENDVVLGDVDEHFSGNYLDEATILKLARDKGYSTASVGKIGPALVFDPTERTGEQTILIDDATGTAKGIPLTRGANGNPGNVAKPGALSANVIEPVRCTVEVADTVLQQGQGMHGSFSRADTWNFMAMQGPDFKAQFVDPAPASNADIGRTIAQLMHAPDIDPDDSYRTIGEGEHSKNGNGLIGGDHLDASDKGKLIGRVLSEALPGGGLSDVSSRVITSEPAANGLITVLDMQQVGETRYFDVAGFPGRTVGLSTTVVPGATTQ